jgi:large subunit ribosomal protein L23
MSSTAHQERLMQVLLGPHVSEKSTGAAASANQVVFKVRSDATKADVRRAVELLFEVKVERVSVVRMPSKSKRFGTNRGERSAWKKAYVRLAAGQTIDFIGAE